MNYFSLQNNYPSKISIQYNIFSFSYGNSFSFPFPLLGMGSDKRRTKDLKSGACSSQYINEEMNNEHKAYLMGG